MRYYAPLDPDCPEVEHFHEALDADPMTAYSGCGDELAEDFEARHRRTCRRCQEFGAANIEVRGG
jgi:hypothetical protein